MPGPGPGTREAVLSQAQLPGAGHVPGSTVGCGAWEGLALARCSRRARETSHPVTGVGQGRLPEIGHMGECRN